MVSGRVGRFARKNPVNERIFLSPPDVGDLEETYVGNAMRSGWIAPLGPDVDQFEREMAARVGRQHAVLLSSGTAALPRVGAAITILLQISWPLASDALRPALTILTVLVFAATSVSHAWIHRGSRWAMRFAITTMVFAFAVEVVGIASGWPFGSYRYGESLGPSVLSVPLIIPLAWAMTAYPALLIARRLASTWTPNNPLAISAIGAVALTTWDLFLDPQMVSAGYWSWNDSTPALPGSPTVPILNFVGWFVCSFLLMLLLSPLPGVPAAEGVPATLWTWTWVGGVIANAFFFGRIGVAFWGGLGMGLVTVPYLMLLARERPES